MELFRGLELAYAQYGDPSGRPVFYFHGWPGSLLEGAFIHHAAFRLGLRIIAVERPGYGESPAAAYGFGDFAAGVATIADELGLERFALAGLSGGAPFALACAWFLRDRVEKTAVIAGMGTPDAPGYPGWIRFGFGLWRRFPLLPAAGLEGFAFLLRHGARPLINLLARMLGPEDRATLERGAAGTLLAASMERAGFQGRRGMAADLALYAQSWGFDPGEIRSPVLFFHGGKDGVVGNGIGPWMAEKIPAAGLEVFPEEGHFSLPLNRMEEVLALF